MKYSLPARILTRSVLSQCDEIKVQYKDRDILIDLAKDLPNQEFVLTIPLNTILDEKELQMYLELTNNKLTLEFENINDVKLYRDNFPNLVYYWKFAPADAYELQSLIDLGVSQILINSALFFDIKWVREHFHGQIRLIPNRAADGILPHKDGVCGTWIRPQDQDLYEDYIDIIEFDTPDLTKQQTLFKLYAKDRYWNSSMNALVTGFNYPVIAAIIPDEIIERRLSCQRVCAKGRCHYCYSAIKFAENASNIVINESLENI